MLTNSQNISKDLNLNKNEANPLHIKDFAGISENLIVYLQWRAVTKNLNDYFIFKADPYKVIKKILFKGFPRENLCVIVMSLQCSFK